MTEQRREGRKIWEEQYIADRKRLIEAAAAEHDRKGAPITRGQRREENKVKREVGNAKRTLWDTAFALATSITMSSTMLTDNASMDMCDAIDGGRQ